MYLFFVLNHPAHYHLFKNTIKELAKHGHECEVFIRSKDVLKTLLVSDGIKYNELSDYSRNKNWILLSSVLGLIKKDIELTSYIRKRKPDLLIGTDWAITNVGAIFRIPSIVFNEDDTKATPENKIFYPLASTLLLPDCCDRGLWENKRISYSGYHELAYLHPNQFNFNKELIAKYIGNNKPYIIVRMVKLTASHDKGKRGIGLDLMEKILSISNNRYKMLISFEGTVPSDFKQFSYNFNPIFMHHFLAGADLVIGDSQTMIAEAAILGTPAVRFNDFVGKLGYLDEIENKYALAYGFHTCQQDKFIDKIDELLNNKKLKESWTNKTKKMLSDKIDVTAFISWFIEKYPESLNTMKRNPDYQYNFK